MQQMQQVATRNFRVVASRNSRSQRYLHEDLRPRLSDWREKVLQSDALYNVAKSLLIESFLPRASLRPVFGGGRSAATGAASTTHLHAEARTGGPGHG
jgi:hypothetical protein